jgi:hypothetical protein
MRILVASLVFAAACGSSPKKESSMVEGSDAPPTCCCKTVPQTSDKEIVPNFAISGRMECSTQQGQCVDDVQCSGQTAPTTDQPSTPSSDTGVPPPPTLGGSAAAPAVP